MTQQPWALINGPCFEKSSLDSFILVVYFQKQQTKYEQPICTATDWSPEKNVHHQEDDEYLWVIMKALEDKDLNIGNFCHLLLEII